MNIGVRVPFLRADFPPDLNDRLRDVLACGYVGAGRRVEAFETALAAYLDVAHVICTSSCTAALTLSYLGAGVERGSTVLSTAMTCAATNIPLLHLGAKIVWLDVDSITGNVTADAVAAGLRDHADARAIVIMDWAGWPCAYDEIGAVAEHAGVPLILDGAQSFGSTYDGTRCGSGAGFICYSFGPTKIFSTVEGGAVIVRDASIARELRALRWYGVDRAARSLVAFWEYDITTPGYRFTANDVFAEIGLQLLPGFDDRLNCHRRIAQVYREGLAGIAGVHVPIEDRRRESNYWMFSIVVEARDRLMRRLHDEGIHAATPHNRNDHLQCFATMHPAAVLAGLDAFAASYMCLPIGPWVTEDDAAHVCSIVRAGW